MRIVGRTYLHTDEDHKTYCSIKFSVRKSLYTNGTPRTLIQMNSACINY